MRVSVLFILLLLVSCKDQKVSKITSIVKEWENREIVFPNSISFVILKQDMICDYSITKGKYSIISYVDSLGCLSCKLQLKSWTKFIVELESTVDYSIPVYFILHPRERQELIAIMRQNNFEYPFCIDENDQFNKINHFPDDMNFRTFLLNEHNRVIAVGNPIANSKIKELYLDIINEKQIKVAANDEVLTSILLDKSYLDIGTFNWRNEQIADFVLTNTGRNLLSIKGVSTSCGCTTVEYDKEPVKSGKSLNIKVKYKAEHPEHFDKTITIHCNAENSPLILKISGNAE